MPGSTTPLGYPYPLDTDRINVARDIQLLAEAVDNSLTTTGGGPSQTLLDLLDPRYVNIIGDTMTGLLRLSADTPTDARHAIGLQYANNHYVNVSGDTMQGKLILEHNNAPTDIGEAVWKGWVDNHFLSSEGAGNPATSEMHAILDMNGHEIVGVHVDANPANVGPNQVITKDWADTNYVNTAGDTMTGPLTVGDPPNSGYGVRAFVEGTLSAAMNTGGSPSLNLRRGPSANAAGQVFIRFEQGGAPGTQIGSITIATGGNDIVYGHGSDYRQKEYSGPITDSAARVVNLANRAYRGHWKGYSSERDFLNAHDIADVAPYAVVGDKDGDEMQQVDFGQLVPLLVSALGSALQRIDRLERAVA